MTESLVGTLEWTRTTGGRLTGRDRLRFMGDFARWQVRSLPAIVAGRLGRTSPNAGTLEDDEFVVPDSQIVHDAEARALELQPPWLTNHGYRGYFYSLALAQSAGLTPDPELLFIAAMFHDVGLCGEISDERCFTLDGVDAAYAAARDLEPEALEIIGNAITLHFNPEVPVEDHGVEAHLLHEGIIYELAAFRRPRIDPLTHSVITDRYPRLDFGERGGAAFIQHARRFPGRNRAVMFCGGYVLPAAAAGILPNMRALMRSLRD